MNRRFSEKRARAMLKLVKETFGEKTRVTIGADGTITVEKADDERAKKGALAPVKDFVL